MATNYETKDLMVRAMDLALESIVTTWRDTGFGTPSSGKVAVTLSRYEILRLMARRAVRKVTQNKMRAETRDAFGIEGVKPDTGYAP